MEEFPSWIVKNQVWSKIYYNCHMEYYTDINITQLKMKTEHIPIQPHNQQLHLKRLMYSSNSPNVFFCSCSSSQRHFISKSSLLILTATPAHFHHDLSMKAHTHIIHKIKESTLSGQTRFFSDFLFPGSTDVEPIVSAKGYL